MLKFKLGVAAATLVAWTGTAQAALFDRGGDMIYDSSQNITWLADWNYAKTSGFDADGLMTWTAANNWANNLNYGGYSDWRLPTVAQPDTTCSASFTPPGGFPTQYLGSGCLGAEMGHLVTLDLGGKPGLGLLDPAGKTALEKANLALLKNVQIWDYWSGTSYLPQPISAWHFFTTSNQQSYGGKIISSYALAVRTGDVSAVPEPQAWAMWLLGFGVLIAARWRRQA